jgi:hypothetical protein
LLKVGDGLMMAGIVFQVFTLALFAILCVDFSWRVSRKAGDLNPIYEDVRSSRYFQGFIFAVVFGFVCILTRCVYRIIELAGGWGNPLMKQEVPFIILDGV